MIARAAALLALPFAAAVAQRFGPRQVDSLPSSVPALVTHYGADALEFGELRLPPGHGPFPVAVVIHGGCWTAGFATLRNTAALATALTDAGIATWNIEYRQLGNPGAGFPGTFLDVGSGVDYLRTLATRYPLDLTRVMLVGHSAGAHLALWAAGRSRLANDSPIRGQNPLRVTSAVAIDGPGDLAAFIGPDARICHNPVIAPFMGGSPVDVPDRYLMASPIELLPLGVSQYLVVASVLPLEDAERYRVRARAAGDSVTVLQVTNGGHFDVIGPGRPAFPAVLALMRAALGAP
jgi:acetyl esterase/lipase